MPTIFDRFTCLDFRVWKLYTKQSCVCTCMHCFSCETERNKQIFRPELGNWHQPKPLSSYFCPFSLSLHTDFQLTRWRGGGVVACVCEGACVPATKSVPKYSFHQSEDISAAPHNFRGYRRGAPWGGGQRAGWCG